MATSTSPQRALIYARISRDREGAGLGVDRQETDCRDLASRLALDVVGVHTDDDVSAYSGKPRPAYRRLLADLAVGRATVVLCWHTDRLHRSPAELEEWIALADPLGIVVHTVKAGPIDLATPSGRMIARQLGAVARYESEHRSERNAAQKEQAAAQGLWLGGRRPFGFKSNGVTLLADEADLIRSGTETLLTGGSLRSVVRAWNAAGSVTSTGRPWAHKGVRDVLGRWRNAGIHEHRGQPGGEASWPAIVTADEVRAVRELLADPARYSGIGNRARWLLSGIALCGGCREVIRSVTSTRRPRVYRCSAYDRPTNGGPGHITRLAQPIDDLVLDVVVGRLARPDLADLVIVAESDVDVPGLRAEVRKVRARLDDIAAMLGDGDLSVTEARTARARATARLELAENALAAGTRTSPLSGLAAAEDPVSAWRDADLDVRREVIRELMTITVQRQGPGRRPFDPATVEIVWRTS